jgi:Endosomal/lysosomal potassium channel TMEM175
VTGRSRGEPDPGVRDPARVVAFSDGVIAIAVTLLVLEIRPPRDTRHLLRGLAVLWPSYVSYVITFMLIGHGVGEPSRVFLPAEGFSSAARPGSGSSEAPMLCRGRNSRSMDPARLMGLDRPVPIGRQLRDMAVRGPGEPGLAPRRCHIVVHLTTTMSHRRGCAGSLAVTGGVQGLLRLLRAADGLGGPGRAGEAAATARRGRRAPGLRPLKSAAGWQGALAELGAACGVVASGPVSLMGLSWSGWVLVAWRCAHGPGHHQPPLGVPGRWTGIGRRSMA